MNPLEDTCPYTLEKIRVKKENSSIIMKIYLNLTTLGLQNGIPGVPRLYFGNHCAEYWHAALE